MKKVLAMVLALFMLVSVLSVGVSADENAPAFVVDNVSAVAGGTVDVAVRIQNNPGIVAMRVAVGYDPAVLTPTAMVEADFKGATFGPLTAPLSVMWVDAIHPDVTDDGAVALITFQVAEDAAPGTYPVSVALVDPADIFNAKFETVTFATVDGSVTVIDFTPGDINDDGNVNVRDLGLLQQYLNGWNVTVNMSAADTTGDGTINVRDYGLLQQYLNGWDVNLGGGTVTPPDQPVDPNPPVDPEPPVEDDDVLTIEEAIAMGSAMEHDTFTEQKYYVTGKITEVYNTQWGNMYLADEAGNTLTIYGTYSADGSSRYDALEVKPVAGDTITVYGIIGQYNGNAQMKNGWITEHIAGEKPVDPQPPVDPEPPVVEGGVIANPEVGVAYKFGMIQGNVSATDVYYLIGGMNSYYMATGTDVNTAIDVYLEETDGGYYMYTQDDKGTKTYINMVVSGTHVNGAYEATASTVYTFDADAKTVIANVNDDTYWFGTRNDKTYTTVGPCAVSYAGFYCQFYSTAGGDIGGGDTPVDPQPPVDPEPPVEGGATIDFGDKANRVSHSGEQQVWAQNGITVTNDKAASTTNVGDYGGEGFPVRFYKGSSVLVEYKGMTKVVFNVDDYKATYVDDLATSITDGTVSVDGLVVTVTFDGAVDSLFIAELVAQVRVDSITVYGEGGDIGGGDTPVDPQPPVDPEPDVPVDPQPPVDPEPDVPSTGSASIDFGDKANRVSHSGEQQVWAQNGITVTNDKAASTTNVGDYGGEGFPVRFYKGSSVLVEYKGITKIVFNVDDYKATYVDDLATSITDGTVSVDGQVVTVTFDAPVDSLFIAELVAQVRVDSIVINGESGDIGGGDAPVDPDVPVVPSEPAGDLTVDDAPVAGTAYKFGMIQGNVSATDVYFLAGGMSGYYMATTTDAAAAIDVYLEDTEGGYYLYTLSGSTKTYINMVVSGTHVNGAYEAAASTVYTFDTENYTLIAEVDGAPYWFGTRNDKTYTTVGPCKTEYAGFFCQLYA